MDKSATASASVTPMFLLFLVFLILKLTKVITWSWLWVTAPLWGGLALALAVLLGFGVFAVFCVVMAAIFNRK